MELYLMILGMGFLPGLAAILLSFPCWFIRHMSNQTIRLLGIILLFTTLVIGFIPIFIEASPLNGLCIPASFLNLLLFYWYEHFLYTKRCPECRHISVRIRANFKNGYKLRCNRCSLSTYWQPWRPWEPFSEK